MTRPNVKTRKVTRDELEKVFKTYEIIKLMENLAQDVSRTLPDAIAAPTLPSYTVATLPSASPEAQIIYVSDGTSNKRLAVSDGAAWRWPDGAIVS